MITNNIGSKFSSSDDNDNIYLIFRTHFSVTKDLPADTVTLECLANKPMKQNPPLYVVWDEKALAVK